MPRTRLERPGRLVSVLSALALAAVIAVVAAGPAVAQTGYGSPDNLGTPAPTTTSIPATTSTVATTSTAAGTTLPPPPIDALGIGGPPGGVPIAQATPVRSDADAKTLPRTGGDPMSLVLLAVVLVAVGVVTTVATRARLARDET